MITYVDCMYFLKKVYDSLNGSINPVAPAVRLALTEPNPSAAKRITIAGTQCMLYVEIRLDSVFEKFNFVHLSDAQIKGGLLFILAHELSHCNQKIIPNRHEDEEYCMFIEYTNNINTINYLEKYDSVLQQYLGPYIIPDIVKQAYYEQREYFKGKEMQYIPISSIKEKVLDGVSILLGEDVYETKYPLANDIYVDVFVCGSIYERFNVIMNKELVLDHYGITKISQFIARGIFTYKKSCVISNGVCAISIYLSSLPIYNVTVLK